MVVKLNGKKEIFCLVPFGQLSTKPSGQLRPCCASGDQLLLNSENGVALNLNEHSLEQAWNAPRMKELREKFIAGAADDGCKECLDNESIGKKSTRNWKNESWKELVNSQIKESVGNGHIILNNGPISLELRLGNLCNLNCRMCNPIFSSRWKSDLEKDQSWKNNASLKDSFSGSLEVSMNQGNWYQSEKFWNEVLQYAKGLRSIYLSGGEPLIIEELNPFLEKLSGINNNIKIRLDSNMMQLPSRSIELLSRFKEVAFGASIDALGPALEFIRNGSSDRVVRENLINIANYGKPFKVNLSVTYMALNALELYEVFRFVKGDDFKNLVSVNIDILYEPSALSVINLPFAAKKAAKESIKKIISDFNSSLSQEEKRNLDSIYSYIKGAEEIRENITEFLEYNNWLDGVHHKRLEDYLPKLQEYLK